MFFVFYFIKISKFTLPGVMLIYERTSKDRKKERKFSADQVFCESLYLCVHWEDPDFWKGGFRCIMGGVRSCNSIF